MSMTAFFIIPGNPPAVHFYELWKEEMLRSHPELHIEVARYPYVESREASQEEMNDVLASLQNQVKKLAEQIKGPVTILGHSLGGYFAYELLLRDDQLIQAAYLLYPFLRVPSFQGRQILSGAHFIQKKSALKSFILNSRKWLEPWLNDLKPISDQELQNSLALAFHEYHTIGKNKSRIEVPNEIRKKLKLFFIPGDIWCTNQVVSSLQQQIHCIQVEQPHAFIVSAKHRQGLWQKIQEHLV